MAAKKPKQNQNNPYRPNLAWALQSIVIASINKGQFLFLLILLPILVLIIKLPASDASKLLHGLLNIFKEAHLLGWASATIELIGGFFVFRLQRRIHHKEIARTTEEKSKLQQQLLNRNVESSKTKK